MICNEKYQEKMVLQIYSIFNYAGVCVCVGRVVLYRNASLVTEVAYFQKCAKKYLLKFIQRNKIKAQETTKSHNGMYKRVKEVRN